MTLLKCAKISLKMLPKKRQSNLSARELIHGHMIRIGCLREATPNNISVSRQPPASTSKSSIIPYSSIIFRFFLLSVAKVVSSRVSVLASRRKVTWRHRLKMLFDYLLWL